MNSTRMTLLHNLSNAVLFQVCWFVAILFDWLWAMPAFALLLFQVWAGGRIARAWPLLVIALIGVLADIVLLNLGVYSFPQPRLNLPGGEPVWMSMLWVAFVFTLPYSLDWLASKPRLFIPLCTAVGPISYSAGVKLEVMAFDWSALPVIAVLWGSVGVLITYCRPLYLRRGLRYPAQPAGLRESQPLSPLAPPD